MRAEKGAGVTQDRCDVLVPIHTQTWGRCGAQTPGVHTPGAQTRPSGTQGGGPDAGSLGTELQSGLGPGEWRHLASLSPSPGPVPGAVRFSAAGSTSRSSVSSRAGSLPCLFC